MEPISVVVNGVQYVPVGSLFGGPAEAVPQCTKAQYAEEAREPVALFDGGLRERIRESLLEPFKNFLVRGLVRRGVSEDEARRHLAALGDGALLKLIFENWDKILQLIMMFFGL
jgi:hypothetical protein